MVETNLIAALFQAQRLPRYQPLRPRRKSRPERQHVTEIRVQLYERSQGMCELRSSPKCWTTITYETMHSCHVVSAARGGKFELGNLKAGCVECHIGWNHAGGKPVPPKGKR